MLRDIYAIPNSESRYKPNVVELNNELDEIIETNYRFIHNNLNIDEKVFLLENSYIFASSNKL